MFTEGNGACEKCGKIVPGDKLKLDPGPAVVMGETSHEAMIIPAS